MTGNAKLADVLVHSDIPRLDVVPSNIDLAGAEIELAGVPGREMIQKESLADCEDRYDYLFIDCPPSLGLLTLNALTTVTEIFIPLQTEFFALHGVSKLIETFQIVKKRLNRDLDITGVIPCLFDARTNLGREVLDNIKQYFGEKVFKTVVHKNVKLAESPSHGKPILLYDPEARGASDYLALAKEVIAREDVQTPPEVEAPTPAPEEVAPVATVTEP